MSAPRKQESEPGELPVSRDRGTVRGSWAPATGLRPMTLTRNSMTTNGPEVRVRRDTMAGDYRHVIPAAKPTYVEAPVTRDAEDRRLGVVRVERIAGFTSKVVRERTTDLRDDEALPSSDRIPQARCLPCKDGGVRAWATHPVFGVLAMCNACHRHYISQPAPWSAWWPLDQ